MLCVTLPQAQISDRNVENYSFPDGDYRMDSIATEKTVFNACKIFLSAEGLSPILSTSAEWESPVRAH
jgi:hypothetical protein